MTNGGQIVTELVTGINGNSISGQAKVNGVKVFFHYHQRSDSFLGSSLLDDDAAQFGEVGKKRNWKYLVLGSIAHCIKNTQPVSQQ